MSPGRVNDGFRRKASSVFTGPADPNFGVSFDTFSKAADVNRATGRSYIEFPWGHLADISNELLSRPVWAFEPCAGLFLQ